MKTKRKVNKVGRKKGSKDKVPRIKAADGIQFGEGMKGVELWQVHKHTAGHPSKFNSPEDLWGKALKYFEWSQLNPLMEETYVGHKKVHKPHPRPYTWSGFRVFTGTSESYFSELRRQSREKGDGYLRVINCIDDAMRTQKFEGAATGFFNANLISRDLSLMERVDHTTNGEAIQPPTIQPVVMRDAPKLKEQS